MRTNNPSTSALRYIPGSQTTGSRSDDLTVLLLWTATGLAISLGLTAFGLAPDIAQSLLVLG
jgi:hypothetical protein